MAAIRWTDSVWAPNTWVCDDCGAGGSGGRKAAQESAARHKCLDNEQGRDRWPSDCW
jgi:hypothetical protein